MKAARLQAYGDVDQFKLEEAPDPAPGPGEVLIKVAASALNPVDLYVRQGFLSQYFPMELPAVIGIDAAGTVAALGSDVTGFAVGDRVAAHLPLNGKGAHAELTVAPLAGLARLPANVDFTAGATLPLPGLTGRQAVDALGIKPGDRVLVAGALGAVGRIAVQYVRELGGQPVSAVRGERLGEGRALAGEAIDVDEASVSATFDYAVVAAGPLVANAIRHVRDGGTLASVVQVPEGANPGDRIKIVNIMGHDDPETLQRIADAAGRGDLAIPIAARFKLSSLGEAHKALAAGARGKIVVLN